MNKYNGSLVINTREYGFLDDAAVRLGSSVKKPETAWTLGEFVTIEFLTSKPKWASFSPSVK